MRVFVALFALSIIGCSNHARSQRPPAVSAVKVEPPLEWEGFAEYFSSLVAMIESRWYAILDESRVAPRTGSHVKVTFAIDSDGRATILKTEGDAGLQGVYACASAFTMSPPGKKWTDAMIAKLGRQQTLTFTFFYQ